MLAWDYYSLLLQALFSWLTCEGHSFAFSRFEQLLSFLQKDIFYFSCFFVSIGFLKKQKFLSLLALLGLLELLGLLGDLQSSLARLLLILSNFWAFVAKLSFYFLFVFFLSIFKKKGTHSRKIWSLAWFPGRRSTYCDFEIGLSTLQLHQIVKPITLLTHIKRYMAWVYIDI